MMLSHWIFFATAVLMNGMANVLGLIYYMLKDDAINEEELEAAEKIYISAHTFNIFAVTAWKYVQVMMLVVFIKYGKPLKDSTKRHIMSKLTESYEKREKMKVQVEKPQPVHLNASLLNTIDDQKEDAKPEKTRAQRLQMAQIRQ